MNRCLLLAGAALNVEERAPRQKLTVTLTDVMVALYSAHEMGDEFRAGASFVAGVLVLAARRAADDAGFEAELVTEIAKIQSGEGEL